MKATGKKKAESRLYTYLPEDNTADVDGILSTALTEKGWEKYRGRTRRKTREAVLRALDAMEPDWRRSMSVSALAEPIPDDAAEDLKEFARSNRLYSFDVDDLVKAKILRHLRETNRGRGTHEAKSVSKGSPDWKRKPGKLLFQGIPHYMVETEGGRIPSKLIRSEKKASSKKETYESGEGEVESYTPDKTEDHDEIVIRLNDGRRIRISNNTRLGKLLRAKTGSRIGYHGWRVNGTNVVHRVHPNSHSRGGWLEEKAASMSRSRIQAQYARHPQSSLDVLASRLARKKWGKRDVVREDAAHAEEFGITGDDKEYLDRYIIARIAERHDRKARLKQAILRGLWERRHDGESFDDALPSRMARFRQYEGSPFGKYDNPVEQAKYNEWASKSDEDVDGEWKRYLSAR